MKRIKYLSLVVVLLAIMVGSTASAEPAIVMKYEIEDWKCSQPWIGWVDDDTWIWVTIPLDLVKVTPGSEPGQWMKECHGNYTWGEVIQAKDYYHPTQWVTVRLGDVEDSCDGYELWWGDRAPCRGNGAFVMNESINPGIKCWSSGVPTSDFNAVATDGGNLHWNCHFNMP
jgi:hypothetical protein